MFLTLSALALLPAASHADGYSAAVYTPNAGTATSDSSSWNYSSGTSTSSGSKVSCSGAMTATFKWSGGTLPQSVIVTQSASASAGALRQGPTGGTPMAACADGLGDTCSITPTYPQNPPGSESLSGSASKTEYTVQSGTSPLTLTCSASASGSLPMTQQTVTDASVSYTASVSAVTIGLSGTTSDGKGGSDILTGQQCTASLQGIPTGFTVTSYSWFVSGGDTFETYDSNAPNATHTTQLVPLSTQDMAAQYFSFYDKKGGTITVSCNATVTAPDGTTLSVMAKSMPITSLKPTASWGVDPKTYPAVDPNTGKINAVNTYIGFNDYSSTNGTFGANTIWYPVTITVPSPFTGGIGCFAQIISQTSSITRTPVGTGASSYTLKFPGPNGTWVAQKTGLDSGFPYPYGFTTDANGNVTGNAPSPYTWQAGTIGASGDIPRGGETASDVDHGGTNWQTSVISYSFSTWLMYEPPAVQNQGKVWVPIMKATWQVTGNAAGGPTNWTATGSYKGPSPSNTTDCPSWSVIMINQEYKP